MKTIKTFDEYNFRRYGMPWVAIVDPKTAKPDFSKDVGGYTGRKGEAGDLYVIEPLEGAVYMYGQKDYRGNNTVRTYAQYLDGKDSLKINPEEAKRIRYIFDKYVEYRNLSAVAELCRLHGYTGKRGRVFKAWHIHVILTRPIYAGYNSYNGHLYRGSHEPIISVQQYNRVQRLLMTTTAGRKRKNKLIQLKPEA